VELRDMEPAAMAKVKEACASEVEAYKVLQWLFDKQWSEVKAYANSKGIKMLGDMPIYVGGQSADVWANRALFTLKSGAPLLRVYPALTNGKPTIGNILRLYPALTLWKPTDRRMLPKYPEDIFTTTINTKENGILSTAT
jgi:hypothetical protein